MQPPKWRTLTLTLCGVSILTLLGAGVWFSSRRSLYVSAAATLPAELAAAKAEHLALTPSDLLAAVPVPDDRNAALLYERISKSDVSGPEGDEFLNVAKGTPRREDKRTVEAGLRKAAPLLRLAEQAAALPDCDFHRDWSLGPDLPLPEYKSLRKIARMLAAQATLQCEWRPEAALHTIWIGAHMADHVGKEPILIAFLVRIALEAIMERPLRRVMCRYADGPEILRMTAASERAFGSAPDLETGFRGEVSECRITAETVRSGKADDGYGLDTRLMLVSRQTAVDAYEAHSISFWRRVMAAIRTNRPDQMAQFRALEAIRAAEDTASVTRDGRQKPTYELDVILSPYFSHASLKAVGNEARRRLRRTMSALFTFRQSHGRFPEQLVDLPSAQEPDPFTGKPLHYRGAAKTFTLYSVGENLTDDGGNAKPPKKGDPPADIVDAYPFAG